MEYSSLLFAICSSPTAICTAIYHDLRKWSQNSAIAQLFGAHSVEFTLSFRTRLRISANTNIAMIIHAKLVLENHIRFYSNTQIKSDSRRMQFITITCYFYWHNAPICLCNSLRDAESRHHFIFNRVSLKINHWLGMNLWNSHPKQKVNSFHCGHFSQLPPFLPHISRVVFFSSRMNISESIWRFSWWRTRNRPLRSFGKAFATMHCFKWVTI